jgi:hypothetical protein
MEKYHRERFEVQKKGLERDKAVYVEDLDP